MTYEELKERIRIHKQNIHIYYQKIDEIRLQQSRYSDVIDENKSVKWNREESARRIEKSELEIKELKLKISNEKQLINEDIYSYLEEEYGFNQKTIQLVFSKAYEDGHSSGYEEIISYAVDYAEFVSDILNSLWTPIKENLPKEKEEYIVTYQPHLGQNLINEVHVGTDSFRGKTSWAKNKYQNVIAWMPYPKAYKKRGG